MDQKMRRDGFALPGSVGDADEHKKRFQKWPKVALFVFSVCTETEKCAVIKEAGPLATRLLQAWPDTVSKSDAVHSHIAIGATTLSWACPIVWSA